MGINWTDELIERLTEHFKEGLPASTSATLLTKEFGIDFTRNMVIGKRVRWGMKTDPETTRRNSRRAANRRHALERAQTGASAPTRVRKPSSFTVTSTKTGLFVPGKELPRSPIPVEDVPPADLVKFADLSESSCRWVYGDPREASHGFCGKQVVPGLSWCDTHRARVFRPPEVRHRPPQPVRIPTILDLEKV